MNISFTQKERMLLEDQKTHEQNCIQMYSNYANIATDTQLKQICKANEQVERHHLDTINQLLSGTVPNMNQQGTQTQTQTQQTTGGSQVTGLSLTDKDICTSILMAEKYVSGAYNTAIFEFRDTNVRDLLNHIQKEEQKHGEAVFKYMESKGLYQVQ